MDRQTAKLLLKQEISLADYEHPISLEELSDRLHCSKRFIRELRKEIEQEGDFPLGFGYGKDGSSGYWPAKTTEQCKEIEQRLQAVILSYSARLEKVRTWKHFPE